MARRTRWPSADSTAHSPALIPRELTAITSRRGALAGLDLDFTTPPRTEILSLHPTSNGMSHSGTWVASAVPGAACGGNAELARTSARAGCKVGTKWPSPRARARSGTATPEGRGWVSGGHSPHRGRWEAARAGGDGQRGRIWVVARGCQAWGVLGRLILCAAALNFNAHNYILTHQTPKPAISSPSTHVPEPFDQRK